MNRLRNYSRRINSRKLFDESKTVHIVILTYKNTNYEYDGIEIEVNDLINIIKSNVENVKINEKDIENDYDVLLVPNDAQKSRNPRTYTLASLLSEQKENVLNVKQKKQLKKALEINFLIPEKLKREQFYKLKEDHFNGFLLYCLYSGEFSNDDNDIELLKNKWKQQTFNLKLFWRDYAKTKLDTFSLLEERWPKIIAQ